MDWKRYAAIFALTFAVGMAVVLATNLVVDPDGIVGWLEVDGFNAQKTHLPDDTRLRKARLLTRGDYDGLLVGTSRVKMAMSPRLNVLARAGAPRTFNAGIEGASMVELERVVELALRHQHPELALIGLDFISFSDRRVLPPSFEHSLFCTDASRWARPSYLLSIDTFVRALATVWDNLRGRTEPIARSGYLRGGERRKIDHREAFDRVLRESYLVQADAYGDFVYGTKQVAALDRAIRSLAEAGVRVELFFTPDHARQMEAVRALGLLPVWERWRLDVARVVDDARERWPKRVRLWDFAGYTEIQSEPIPARGSGDEMRWWWESTHFKEETGDQILRRILAPASRPRPLRGFGMPVDAQELDRRHVALRVQRERWAEDFPEEVRQVEAFVEETAAIRRAIPPFEGR